jgi:DNA-binding transcriptional regulator YiaG
MNDLESLRERLAGRFPHASLVIDRPKIKTGSWFLDAELQSHLVVVEWRADRGFGISTPSEDDFGAKPDEVYQSGDAAYNRVVELLLGQINTIPGAGLPKIRESCQLSQTELAQRLQINQGAVSRLERRRDMRIQTLRRLVSAMGGELELLARFPDHTVRIQLDELLGWEKARA